MSEKPAEKMLPGESIVQITSSQAAFRLVSNELTMVVRGPKANQAETNTH
jgi:hypothetical protein